MKRFSRIDEMLKIYKAYRRRQFYCNFFPSRLWIEPTSLCNLRCIMCLNKELNRRQHGYMDLDLYKKIIDECSGKIYDIYLHHRGESLLNPDLFEMIKYAKENRIYTRLHTNGTLLNKEMAEEVIESGLDFLSFSFDGYDKETYESIRIGGRFEMVLGNIINFLRLKRYLHSKKPYTVLTVIEFPDKKGELKLHKEEFMKRFRGLPLDSIRIRAPHNWAGGYKNRYNTHRILKSFIPCTFLWYSLTILWDGTILPCPQDFFGRLRLGNIKDGSLQEFWNGKIEMELRKKMWEKSYKELEPCNNCDRLWRSNILGIPLEGAVNFIRDNLYGYL